VASSGSGAHPVVLVFGLQDGVARWLTRRLRAAGVVAAHLPPDLPLPAAQSVCAAADAGVHLFSAGQGMDGRFLEIWQLLAEAGRARYLLVHELGPATLDVNEAAAIASRVLEEDVLTTTLPLLDDDESVIGVLDVATGQQYFPDGTLEAPRDDFIDAVEAETNTLYDAADAVGVNPHEAIRQGLLAPAVTIDTRSGAGVDWLAAHLPKRSVPAASTVLPGDDAEQPLIAAGSQGCALGPSLTILGSATQPVTISALSDLLEPALVSRLPAGAVAAARIEPVPTLGSWLVALE
jgi:hypothetical protein